MQESRLTPQGLVVLAALGGAAIVLGAIVVTAIPALHTTPVSVASFVFLSVLFYVVALTVVRRRTGTDSYTLAFVGPPESGKTVFVSVALDELFRSSISRYTFRSSGAETAEPVNLVTSGLRGGVWPARTPDDKWILYQLKVFFARSFFFGDRTAKLSIGDFAGQNIEQFYSTSGTWLHRAEYFKFVTGADAVMFFVDGRTLVEPHLGNLPNLEAQFKAALQAVYDLKAPASPRMKTPIAIVVTKADLLVREYKKVFGADNSIYKAIDQGFTKAHGTSGDPARPVSPAVVREIVDEITGAFDSAVRGLVRQRIGGFLELGERLCESFALFVVSSVGYVDERGTPPGTLRPYGVLEPLLWTIDRLEGRGA